MSTLNELTNAQAAQRESGGIYLKYDDFRLLDDIMEDYFNDKSDTQRNHTLQSDMTAEDKALMWKIKTILHNMESKRLR